MPPLPILDTTEDDITLETILLSGKIYPAYVYFCQKSVQIYKIKKIINKVEKHEPNSLHGK